jgi:opacity protein-like surface antigen
MPYPKYTRLAWRFSLLIFFSFAGCWAHAQRLVLPSPESTSFISPSPQSSPTSADQVQMLKTYPDGTKKIVPLASLNFHDDGKAFGGPPQLSLYSDSANPIDKSSPERLSVAPIGTVGAPATINSTLPASPDPMGGPTTTAAGDPMGGGSAPIDPLSGTAPKGSPPPLQTVSGKPAPVSSAETTIELGTYEDFFMNAAIGGSIQNQLTARRVYNGTNMQAYPYQGISGENFTFNPGFRFDVEFGYNIYDWLGVSLQTGIVYNGINQYNVTLATGQSYHNSADGELVQVPVQIDGILRWPGATAFKPFIGGGVGAVWQQLDVNNYYFNTSDVQGNYCRSAFQFGFNAQLGANYTVTPGVDFYGVFKLLGAFTPRIGNYDFENSYNFALEVGIQSRF